MKIGFNRGPGWASRSVPGLRRVTQKLLAALFAVAAVPAWAVHPYQQWADEFGLDMNASYDGTRVMSMEGGTFEAIERRAPGKMYTEVTVGNMTSGILLREDLGKGYMLMPSMGMYRETSLEDGLMQSSNGMEFSKIEKMGSETINGFPSTKYQTRFKDNEGKGAGFVWVTDSGVPIKMDMIYSSKDTKGMRISMEFTELNLREQDPSVFELPADLKPMNFGDLGSLMQMGGAATAGNMAPAPAQPDPAQPDPAQAGNDDLAARQQACLQDASAQAAAEREKAEKKRKFGKLLGAVARTTSRLGIGPDVSSVYRDVYNANATANDIAVIAEELGISTDEVERCRNP